MSLYVSYPKPKKVKQRCLAKEFAENLKLSDYEDCLLAEEETETTPAPEETTAAPAKTTTTAATIKVTGNTPCNTPCVCMIA